METIDILIYITSNLITEGPSVDNTHILLRDNEVSIVRHIYAFAFGVSASSRWLYIYLFCSKVWTHCQPNHVFRMI
jgi:hypothetical protein